MGDLVRQAVLIIEQRENQFAVHDLQDRCRASHDHIDGDFVEAPGDRYADLIWDSIGTPLEDDTIVIFPLLGENHPPSA